MAEQHATNPSSFGWHNVFSPEGSGPAIEDVWPSLYIGVDRLDEMKRKARELSWAKSTVDLWRREAGEVLESEPRFVPGQPGGRAGMHRAGQGEQVLFDRTQNETAWDPIAMETIQTDEIMRRSWVTLNHERIRRLMVSLGFLYGITGEERYSRWVWEGLRRSVELYARPPGFDTEQAHTVVYGGLYEAQSMLHLLQAYELVREGPGSTPEDLDRVCSVIFERVGDMLCRWMDVMPVHNMSCWAMAALAELGRHLGRADWVQKSLTSERNGLRALLRHGFPRAERTGRPDGLWFETSTFYNFYAGIPLIVLYRAGQREGKVDEDLAGRFGSFFETPLHLADSDLRLLCLSDRVAPGRFSLAQMRHVYEYAAGQVDPGRYGPILSRLYQASGAQRTGWSALAWGPDTLPDPGNLPRENRVFEAARIVTLRRHIGRGEVCLWFLGGQDGDPYEGHHHHDKLSFSIHAFGEIVTSDLGRPSGIDRGSWSTFLSGTLSHNTLMVDETDQGPMKSLRFDARVDSNVPRVRSAVSTDPYENQRQVLEALAERNHRVQDGVYEGVTLDRSLHFDVPYVVLVDRCTARGPKRFGLVFHASGSLVTSPETSASAEPTGLPTLPADGTFGLFTGRTSADPVTRLVADWRIRADLWLRLVAITDGPFEATWGSTPGNPSRYRRGTVLLRAPGTERRFLSVLELHNGSPTLCGVEWSSNEKPRLLLSDGSERTYCEA